MYRGLRAAQEQVEVRVKSCQGARLILFLELVSVTAAQVVIEGALSMVCHQKHEVIVLNAVAEVFNDVGASQLFEQLDLRQQPVFCPFPFLNGSFDGYNISSRSTKDNLKQRIIACKKPTFLMLGSRSGIRTLIPPSYTPPCTACHIGKGLEVCACGSKEHRKSTALS